MLDEAIRSAIIQHIEEIAMRRDEPINDSTDLYEDLSIWGDDFYDLFDWIAETFGTDFSTIDFSKLVPGEGAGELGITRILTGKSPYQKCTVGHLLAAVERGRW